MNGIHTQLYIGIDQSEAVEIAIYCILFDFGGKSSIGMTGCAVHGQLENMIVGNRLNKWTNGTFSLFTPYQTHDGKSNAFIVDIIQLEETSFPYYR